MQSLNLGWLQSGIKVGSGVCHPASQDLARLGPGFTRLARLSLRRAVRGSRCWGRQKSLACHNYGGFECEVGVQLTSDMGLWVKVRDSAVSTQLGLLPAMLGTKVLTLAAAFC